MSRSVTAPSLRAGRRLLPAAVLLLSGCTDLFFQPSGHVYSDPADAGLKAEAIKFSSADGTGLTGLFFPPAGRPKATVVHFHGNAQNMTAHYPFSAWLAAEGYNVFIFDYRGYGASGGKAGLDGVVEDGKAALAHALKLPGARADKVVVFGQSLGGAIAVAAVAESGFKPAALVIEGSFHSYRGVAAAVLRSRWFTWPFSWLPYLVVSGRHSPAAYIGAMDCPKFFLHAAGDITVPYAQGVLLYAAAGQPKEFHEVPSGHIEAFATFRPSFGSPLLRFLDKALK